MSYSILAVHPDDDFNPFDPDALGALREAYTWITQPRMMTPGEVIYPTAYYNQVAEMLRRAIKNAEARKDEMP